MQTNLKPGVTPCSLSCAIPSPQHAASLPEQMRQLRKLGSLTCVPSEETGRRNSIHTYKRTDAAVHTAVVAACRAFSKLEVDLCVACCSSTLVVRPRAVRAAMSAAHNMPRDSKSFQHTE